MKDVNLIGSIIVMRGERKLSPHSMSEHCRFIKCSVGSLMKGEHKCLSYFLVFLSGSHCDFHGIPFKELMFGTSLSVQWLRFHASTAGGTGSTPGQGTKIPQAVWHDQNKIKLDCVNGCTTL